MNGVHAYAADVDGDRFWECFEDLRDNSRYPGSEDRKIEFPYFYDLVEAVLGQDNIPENVRRMYDEYHESDDKMEEISENEGGNDSD